jgi:malate dehydrogenase (oxaloacetate-decarboxylating)(NADP+)
VLFKRFADDRRDRYQALDTEDPRPSSTRSLMEPTFGGINLEDIAAPERFIIEQALRDRMVHPVMHDDQHGTAIISAAGLINACHHRADLKGCSHYCRERRQRCRAGLYPHDQVHPVFRMKT